MTAPPRRTWLYWTGLTLATLTVLAIMTFWLGTAVWSLAAQAGWWRP